MTVVLLVIRLVLAAVFAVAAVSKLADLAGSRRAMRDFGVPERFAGSVAALLPAGELGIAAMLVVDVSARWGAVAALVLLASFAARIGVMVSRGKAPDCHCFGQLHSRPVGVGTLVRNLALAGLAAVVVWQPGGDDGWALAGLVAAAALVLQGWFSHQLFRQNGRILARLAQLEQSPAAPAEPNLVVGSRAPYFSLPSQRGSEVSLESLLAAGQPLLLAFISPKCAACEELLPRLAAWQREVSGELTVAVVSQADPAGAGSDAASHGLEHVLVQPDNALSEHYGVRWTPSALVIDAEGRVARPLARGQDAIAELVPDHHPGLTAHADADRSAGRPGRGLEQRATVVAGDDRLGGRESVSANHAAATPHGFDPSAAEGSKPADPRVVNVLPEDGTAHSNKPHRRPTTLAALAMGGVGAQVISEASAQPEAEDAAAHQRSRVRASLRATDASIRAHTRRLNHALRGVRRVQPGSHATAEVVHSIRRERSDILRRRKKLLNLPSSEHGARRAQALAAQSLAALADALHNFDQALHSQHDKDTAHHVRKAKQSVARAKLARRRANTILNLSHPPSPASQRRSMR